MCQRYCFDDLSKDISSSGINEFTLEQLATMLSD